VTKIKETGIEREREARRWSGETPKRMAAIPSIFAEYE